MTSPCVGAATAPRAESTALILAVLWIRQLVAWFEHAPPWFEIAYDCEHTANIAQGKQAAVCNSDLHVFCCDHSSNGLRSTPLPALHGHAIAVIKVILGMKLLIRSANMRCVNTPSPLICMTGTLCVPFKTPICVQCSGGRSGSGFCRSLRFHPDAPVLIGHQSRFDVASPLAVAPQAHLHPAIGRRVDIDHAPDARHGYLCDWPLRMCSLCSRVKSMAGLIFVPVLKLLLTNPSSWNPDCRLAGNSGPDDWPRSFWCLSCPLWLRYHSWSRRCAVVDSIAACG